MIRHVNRFCAFGGGTRGITPSDDILHSNNLVCISMVGSLFIGYRVAVNGREGDITVYHRGEVVFLGAGGTVRCPEQELQTWFVGGGSGIGRLRKCCTGFDLGFRLRPSPQGAAIRIQGNFDPDNRLTDRNIAQVFSYFGLRLRQLSLGFRSRICLTKLFPPGNPLIITARIICTSGIGVLRQFPGGQRCIMPYSRCLESVRPSRVGRSFFIKLHSMWKGAFSFILYIGGWFIAVTLHLFV